MLLNSAQYKKGEKNTVEIEEEGSQVSYLASPSALLCPTYKLIFSLSLKVRFLSHTYYADGEYTLHADSLRATA